MEREATFYVLKKLQTRLTNLEYKVRPSPLSQSRYIVVIGIKKGAIIRVSDHYTPINRKFSRFYMQLRTWREYYLFTDQHSIEQHNFYNMPSIDEMIEEVVKYLSTGNE
jgi:hypothetical protein